MEPIYQAFTSISLDAVGFQGLLGAILVSGALIFRLVVPRPDKDDRF